MVTNKELIGSDPNQIRMEILQESGWEELRKEARKIEGDLDVKLSSYAKLGARVTQGGILHFLLFFFFRILASIIMEFWFGVFKV